jgi:hypothetical protein
MKLAIVVCLAFGVLSACSQEAAFDVGVEPSLGVPVTVFREVPVVTADLGVLGTIQTTLPPDIEEVALEPVSGSGRPSLLWFGAIGLGLMSVAVTIAARHQETGKLESSS